MCLALPLKNILLIYKQYFSVCSNKLQPNKYHFAKREVHYLGHIVGAEGVKPDPGKMEAVSSYLIPQSVHKLQ